MLFRSLYSKLGYDTFKDFTPITLLATVPNVMVVHPSVPAKSLNDLIKLAKAKPGSLNFGSGGLGSGSQLGSELFKTLSKINIVHVPYKGATMAAVALMGGEVDEVVVSVASSLPYIRTGKVRPLAVLSIKRVAALPDVPTAIESGVKGFLMSIWYGMLAPGRLPPELTARLNQEALKALATADLKERLSAQGVDPWPGSATEFEQLVRNETARYAKVIEKAGLKKE